MLSKHCGILPLFLHPGSTACWTWGFRICFPELSQDRLSLLFHPYMHFDVFFPPILLIFFLTCKIIPALHQAQSLSLPWKPPLFTAGALQSLPNGCFAQPCSHTGWWCGVCCFQTQAVLCVLGCSWPPQPPPTWDMPRVLLSPRCQLAIGTTSAPAEDHCSKAVLSSKTRS